LQSEIDRYTVLMSEATGHQRESAWRRLAQTILAQVICFNRRRAGEVSRVTLQDHSRGTKADLSSDVQLGLGKFENNSSYIGRVISFYFVFVYLY